jgi:hypothetical protein
MHVPLSDNITTGEGESARERPSARSVEREVRLEGAPSSEELIRARIEDGFYHTPAVVDVVARQIIASGELG